jgi:lysozyme
MKISDEGIQFICQLEGIRSYTYKDVAGCLTIGVGHMLTKDEMMIGRIKIGGEDVLYSDGLSQDQITSLLRQDLTDVESQIGLTIYAMPYSAPILSQCQYDALCSFVFNIGTGAFHKSTLRKKLIHGLLCDVPEQMRRWVYAGGEIIDGLKKRREREVEMWLWETDKEEEIKDFMPEYNTFLYPFRAMQFRVHELAIEKKWYDGQSERNPLELLALIVEEFGEAVRAVREGSQESKKIPGYSCLEEELADIVIRVMDASEYHQVRLNEAIVAKHEYNKTRPERHGGKLY